MQGDDALQFFVDLVCYEADADVRLNAFLREVEYRPCLQIALRDTECPFHVPKAFILENCDEFAVAVREQIVLLHDLEDKMHESDDEK